MNQFNMDQIGRKISNLRREQNMTQMELADKLAETGGLSVQVVEPVLKTAGIAIAARLASGFCKDAQEEGLGAAVELAGTALALAAALPLMTAVLDVLAQLL